MTQAKARLYKTAIVAEPIDGYQVGDTVTVQFIGRAGFGLNFRISYPDKPTVVVSDTYLTDFVL